MALKQLLEAIRHVRVLARDRNGVRLRGAGDVVANAGPDGSLLLSESGTWCDTGGPPVRFTNAFRWRFEETGLELSHERRGPHSPVPLVHLEHVADGHWIARRPHLCGTDSYSATLWTSPHRVVLRWRVRGPSKLQLLRAVYSTPSDAHPTAPDP